MRGRQEMSVWRAARSSGGAARRSRTGLARIRSERHDHEQPVGATAPGVEASAGIGSWSANRTCGIHNIVPGRRRRCASSGAAPKRLAQRRGGDVHWRYAASFPVGPADHGSLLPRDRLNGTAPRDVAAVQRGYGNCSLPHGLSRVPGWRSGRAGDAGNSTHRRHGLRPVGREPVSDALRRERCCLGAERVAGSRSSHTSGPCVNSAGHAAPPCAKLPCCEEALGSTDSREEMSA